MELIKRNIHMDRVKRSTVMQFTMEEDLNLPEDKPDISTLNLEKGEIDLEGRVDNLCYLSKSADNREKPLLRRLFH